MPALLQVFGHERVSILDGGLPGWTRVGGPIESGPAAPVERTSFKATYDASLVADMKDIKEFAAGKGSGILLDGRSAARFSGEAPEPRPNLPSGHIPNSVNLPFTEVLKGTERVASADHIRALCKVIGIDLTAPVTTLCGSGVTGALVALALHQVGIKARVYDGKTPFLQGNGP